MSVPLAAGSMPGSAAADGLFAIVPVLIGIGFVVVIGTIIYRFYAARREGLDPLAGDLQLMAAARDSQLLAPERSPEERLAEIDALLAAGTITEDEHEAARARIISTL
ncbi:hypothetical protein [Longivirga aurantiaca]|uniref:SHOCT domain-containing protein n=1 Tax=Longivirga aurantiaca TaxID=1837743 RepID=A0ABW1SZ98_9ACTN